MLDMGRQQQLVDHVQHEERSHAVIGEALPRLGEGEIGEALGMAEASAARPLVERNDAAQISGSPNRTLRRLNKPGSSRTGLFRRIGEPPVRLLRRLVVLGLLAGLAPRLIDRLDKTAGLAARTDRGAALDAGVADGRQDPR